MNTMNKYDEELVNYMKTLEKDDSTLYLEKMQKVIDWKKEHRELVGLHISLYPSVKDVTNEEIAKEMFEIELNSAEGKLKEVDVEGM